ncbi:hypothetical protein GGX14DRAFT_579343 [Mycena pura]|uniref:LysM domain-containing protein n=1 Tax=Mycena pura TaxID=153505 RepID=A0AAD6UND9_9AGAR|nr:hypothetical protein GGX14DRAFT_579343 [Mycena pura]
MTSASTCAAVTTQYSVSLYDVYSSNFLAQTDCMVEAGSTICLPQSCTTYTVATNDTCTTVANGANITSAQLHAYNPNLGTPSCQNIAQDVGTLICVSPHGGFPQVSGTSGASAPTGTATGLAPVPTPTADGSTAACGEWAMVLAGHFCSTLALKYSITVDDLYTMNPEINANGSNLLANYYYSSLGHTEYPREVAVCHRVATEDSAPKCPSVPAGAFSTTTTTALATTGTNFTMIITFSYPLVTATATSVSYETITAPGVAAPTNVAPGTRTAACGYYYDIQGFFFSCAAAGDTLESISNLVGVAEADLITWNTGKSSTKLPLSLVLLKYGAQSSPPGGNYTPIPATPPENASPFATSACADYHTIAANETCASIAAGQDISMQFFLNLNPGLTCAGLLAGVAYCDFPLSWVGETLPGYTVNELRPTVQHMPPAFPSPDKYDVCGLKAAAARIRMSAFMPARKKKKNGRCPSPGYQNKIVMIEI